MKKLLVAAMLPFSLFGNAQTDSTNALTDTAQIKFIEPPDSTGFGTPDGQLVSKEIGPAGGTIASDDGKVELIFPADALTANTTISIQPLTNLAPNGTGKAYQFEPSGIQFRKPVQIIFRYTEEEADTCPPELMGFAMQDHTGKWSFFNYEDWDSSANILRGFIQHFSTGSKVQNMRLRPDRSQLFVNRETQLSIIDLSRFFGKTEGGDKMYKPAALKKDYINIWFVNGSQGGNSRVGYVDPSKVGSAGNHYFDLAVYKAPGTFPNDNPVTISAKILVQGKKGTMAVLKEIKCHIYIYDAYEVKVNTAWDNTVFGQTTGRWKDTSKCRFVLTTYNSPKGKKTVWLEKEITNSLFLWENRQCQTGCTCEYLNEEYCRGPIHIAGIKDINISNSVSENKTATVFFQPAKAILPLVKTTCPRGGNSFNPPMPFLYALPVMIKFELRDGEQEQKFEGPAISQCKIVIMRVSEDW